MVAQNAAAAQRDSCVSVLMDKHNEAAIRAIYNLTLISLIESSTIQIQYKKEQRVLRFCFDLGRNQREPILLQKLF